MPEIDQMMLLTSPIRGLSETTSKVSEYITSLKPQFKMLLNFLESTYVKF